jgi:hypothetical protein
MRRLLASVAVLAAALLAPSTALATGKPVLSGPASSNATAPVGVHLSWPSVGVLVSYDVFRDTIAPGAGCPAAHSGVDLSGPLLDGVGYDDSVSSQNIYCYWVQADDGLTGAIDSDPVQFTYDTSPPAAPVVVWIGDNGCSPFTLVSATATDNLGPVTVTTGGPFPYTPPGTPFAAVTPTPTVTATDAAGNQSSTSVPGQFEDATRPPAPVLEVDTDPAQLKATLSWDNSAPDDGSPIANYRLRRKGPEGIVTNTVPHATSSVAFQNLQPDATYEFTLDATDACGFGTTSVRLVRLNDTTPPSLPLVAQPAFDSTAKSVRLSWIPSSDNIQVDHYEILRNGLPLGATDAAVYTDTAPGQHAMLTYVVRAVDTNGNEADSAPVTITTPDWTPPTAPVLTLDPPQGTTVTLHWPAAKDNVGVVRYDILRDDKVKDSEPGGVRAYKDLNVPPGLHTWRVRAFDDAGNSTDSAPQALKVVKPHASA